MKTLRSFRCHKPTSTRHRGCRQGERWARRHRRAVIVIHTYHHLRRGCDVTLNLRWARQGLTQFQRERFNEQYQIWAMAGWIASGGFQIMNGRVACWGRIPLSVAAEFVLDLAALVAHRTPPEAPTPLPGERTTHEHQTPE